MRASFAAKLGIGFAVLLVLFAVYVFSYGPAFAYTNSGNATLETMNAIDRFYGPVEAIARWTGCETSLHEYITSW